MTGWNGQGLPPAAMARLERAKNSELRTSLLSVPAAYGLETVGFDTVGEVMGCIVQQISYTGYAGNTTYWGSAGYPTQVMTSSSRFYGFGPFVTAMTHGWNTAMYRMQQEAAALGADGVVGVSLRQNHFDGNAREFVAMGTAVRARTTKQYTLPAPFTTDLPGTDFAKLLLSGWMPVALRIGFEVATRMDDYTTQAQTWTSMNTEVTGYTDLVQQARALARQRFDRAIREAKADGGIVSHMGLRIWETGEPRNHVAEATIRGTAIAAFGGKRAPQPPSPLTIMPVRSMSRSRKGRQR
jgi:uncharacterized protein YbjQ (UPF0145 family)